MPTSRIFFANPNFKDENVAFATNSYIYSIGSLGTLQDDVIEDRKIICEDIRNNDLEKKQICYKASIGHPNHTGAIAYFNAISPFL